MALIFDIETIGKEFENLDQVTQANLTRWIKKDAFDNNEKYDALLDDLKNGMGFSPLTGEIVVLGVYDTDRNEGVVYYQAPDTGAQIEREENITYKPATEKEMLNLFWQGATKYKEFVSFNGRTFDVPFMMMRSAVHGIRPSLNLMRNRYLNNNQEIKHIDLLDQLSFYGAVRRRGSLHLFCELFNIKSPKTLGITGDDVGRLFKERQYKKIAEYNSWDLIATWELFEKWKQFLAFED